MFVKITQEDINFTITYDCKRVSYQYLHDKKRKKIKSVLLCLDVGEQEERTREFIVGDQKHKIYIMNDEGKTIDRIAC